MSEDNNNKKKPETFEHLHAKPVTRREFLATGLIPFTASALMPSWLQIFAKAGVAQAQDLACKATVPLCNFVGLKLSGGAALAANFVPHDKSLQLLPSYSKMGLGKGSNLALARAFSNNAPFYDQSQILAGIMSVATPATLAQSSFVGVCVRSQDDSQANKFDITGLVAKAGLSGKILPNLGRANTETGVNNLAAYMRPSAPLIVGRFEDIPNSLGVAGTLGGLSQNQQKALFRSLQNLSTSQANKLSGLNGADTLRRLASESQSQNLQLVSDRSSLDIDPLSNAAFAQAWNVNNNTNKSSMDFAFATMMYNALNGNAGTVNLEIGGYDYHNNTRTSGDQKDREAGVVIGKILQSFAVMGKKGFLVVTSDGSVSSPESDVAGGPWASDRGTAGSAYLIAYDPTTPPQTKSFQLGHFTSGQGADDAFVSGASPETAAGAMFVNYLAFNQQIGMVDALLPRVFDNAQIDLIRIFG